MKIYQEFNGSGSGERCLEVPARDQERVKAMSPHELREYMEEHNDGVVVTERVSCDWVDPPYVA